MGKIVKFDESKRKNFKRVTPVERKEEPADLRRVRTRKKTKESRRYKAREDYRPGFWEGLF